MEKLHYMYVMTPTDPAKTVSRDNWTDYDRETFQLHVERINAALENGNLVLAGRTLDDDGKGPAIVIFQADSEEEAQAFFAAEPFVTRGFVTAVLHKFSNPMMKDSE